METLERLERTERELAEHWRSVSVALDAAGSASGLSFSTEEEEALGERFGDALAALQTALTHADEYVAELTDPTEVAETKRSVAFFRDQHKRHVVNVRKLLVAYSQRAKRERLEQTRASLMSKRASAAANSNKSASATAQGAALDVTESFKRTRNVLSQELGRMASVTKVLDDGRTSLKTSHDEFSGVQTELAGVRQQLTALQWQARQDRLWIGAGIALLVATVLFIVHERTGLLIV